MAYARIVGSRQWTWQMRQGTGDPVAFGREPWMPANRRLIVFLQQSSVEWCSSLWLHLIAEVSTASSDTVPVDSIAWQEKVGDMRLRNWHSPVQLSLIAQPQHWLRKCQTAGPFALAAIAIALPT
jgi:hypothetical protein